MDGLKNIAKGGWHPSGDRSIHRDTWKSDLKGIATGKKNDPYESARNHQSAPLSSLKDPESFGPPPKHSAYYGGQSQAQSVVAKAPEPSEWGARAPALKPRRDEQGADEVKPAGPYKMNTTGLRTDNLPKPPSRLLNGGASSPASTSSPVLPPRQAPRQTPAQVGPPPVLPPRQNEHPDEHTPAPPPPYEKAVQIARDNPELINQNTIRRLGQAGVSVPAFGIGSPSQASTPQISSHAPQLNELQQRFSRLNAGAASGVPISTTANTLAAAAQKKAPPRPPPKKAELHGVNVLGQSSTGGAPQPPPVPLNSKPKAP